MPLRKYLRVSRGLTLELRIYVTGSDTSYFTRGMLEDLVLQLRPIITRKIAEERDALPGVSSTGGASSTSASSTGKRAKKSRPRKDEIEGDGYRASAFLVDVVTRHVVLTSKTSVDLAQVRIRDEEDDAADYPNEEDEDIKQKPHLRSDYAGSNVWHKALCLLISSTDPLLQQPGQSTITTKGRVTKGRAQARSKSKTSAIEQDGRGNLELAQMDKWLSSQLGPEVEAQASA
ncbi:hypothetical protein PYCC9005_000110 [Savitreella phatthalungensis]